MKTQLAIPAPRILTRLLPGTAGTAPAMKGRSMRLAIAAPVIAAALCLLTASHAAAQEAAPTNLQPRVTVAGKKAAVSQWFRAESAHFIVFSDAGEDDVSLLLDNLERLDHLLRLYTLPAGSAERPEPKLTLYFHNSVTDLRGVDASPPVDAVGLYSSCTRGVQGFAANLETLRGLRDEQLDKAPLNPTLSYVFEAYARHFLYRHTDIRMPSAFIDGFAQYFSSVRFSERQMVLGRVPKGLGSYLKFLSDGRTYSLDYADVIQGNTAGARSYGGAAGVQLEFEAKAWLLTHYMLSSDENRKRLSVYLAAVGRGADATLAFERVLGVKRADLNHTMWRYGLKGLPTLRVEQPALPPVRVSMRSLPQAAGEFVLAHAALKACPDREAGEALLKQVAAMAQRFPQDDMARLTLSRAQIDWGDPQDALPAVNSMLREDEAQFEAQQLLGLAHLRLASRGEGEARRVHAESARRHLQRAGELNPQSNEVALAALRAEVLAMEVPASSTLEGVIAAWQRAREVDALGRSAALAYAFTGKADQAHGTLAALAQNPSDAQAATWARQWRSRLETGVSRGDILAELRRDITQDQPLKEWTIDKERVLQLVERNAGLEAADSVIKEIARQNDSDTGSKAPGGSGNR